MKKTYDLALYSFFGWGLEGIYNKITMGRFKKPNFSWLPFKPMYGIAATLLISARPYKRGKKLAVFLMIPAVVEYVSGYWLKKTFGLCYWDYSREKGNIQGLVCPKFLFYWGGLSYFLVDVFQPLLEMLTKKYQRVFMPMFSALTIMFFADTQCNLMRRYHDKSKKALKSPIA